MYFREMSGPSSCHIDNRRSSSQQAQDKHGMDEAARTLRSRAGV
jgi:hypothetical protein